MLVLQLIETSKMLIKVKRMELRSRIRAQANQESVNNGGEEASDTKKDK